MKSCKYTCVCCGHKSLETLFDFEVCPVCGWEDDPLQTRFPLEKRSNKISLVEAQVNFAKLGVLYKGFVNYATGEEFEKDSDWRPFSKKDIVEMKEEEVNEIDYPVDMTKMYYWTDRYWLRK